jgi:hypothetical protein
MPALNDFVAHIITIEQGKSFPNKSQIIPESGRNVDGNTVTCFIPATSGNYFAAWWWAIGQRKNLAYSAEFIRDGESVVHLLFGPDDAADRQAWREIGKMTQKTRHDGIFNFEQ